MLALVVDDQETVLTVVSAVLRRAGFRVLRARSLTAARRVCSRMSLPLDLIVADIHMPDGSGFGLSREVRERRPGVPLLFISGGNFDQEVRTHLTEGRAYLPKPFLPPQLLASVSELMAAARYRMARGATA